MTGSILRCLPCQHAAPSLLVVGGSENTEVLDEKPF